MNNSKRFIGFILIIFSFILLHNAIITGLGNLFAFFKEDNRSSLIDEAYREKVELLEIKISEYERSMNELKIYEGSSFVLGKIALRDIYDFYNYLVIATDTAVDKGAAVINEDGLVGLVEEANKTTAKVSLLTGENSISVSIGECYGLISGYDHKNNTLIVRNINNYKDIEIGQEVLTSGLQEIDAGIHIGYVSDIEVTELEKIVYVEPSVDYENLNYIMVIDR